MTGKPNIQKSKEWYAKAQKLIPNQAQTMSRTQSQFVEGVHPIFLQSGKGSHVIDVDGNEYIDYSMSLGPIVLGYQYKQVDQAIKEQLKEGIILTLPNPLEVEVAQTLTEIIPSAEMVKYAKTGSEADSAAVRLARAYTGREKIAYCGYHGWHEWYISTTSRKAGIPKALEQLMKPFEYNNIESLQKIFNENKNEIAAVIMEPISIFEPKKNFLQEVRKLCNENGTLLIFDEIVTGFRWAIGGAQEYYGVTPDISTFGKAISNGMPLSAVVGKAEIMKRMEADDFFFSGTFGGELLSLAAARATINEIRTKPVIKKQWSNGKKIKNNFNEAAKNNGVDAKCMGDAPHTVFVFNQQNNYTTFEVKSLFIQETIKRGALITGSNMTCFKHSKEDIEKTNQAITESLEIVGKALKENNLKEKIEGKIIREIFKRW